MGTYIIGAGGAGKEVLGWMLDMGYKPDGFLDEDPRPVRGVDYKVLGNPFRFPYAIGDRVVLAVGETVRKMDIARHLDMLHVDVIGIRHPLSTIAPLASVGRGVIMYPGSAISATAYVGDFVLMNVGAWVGHDAVVDSGCTLGPHSGVYGYATVGEGCYLGGHAVVLPKVVVKTYATVGAGAVVTKDVDSHHIVKGIPAR